MHPERAARWTEDQEAAITARGVDVLVSAAAGSGKTSVLVERVIRRILGGEAPTSIERLLVVTFTESAAAEMKERIRAALLKAAREQGLRKAVQELAIFGRAQISTLHGFCLRLLRRHFHAIGLDPNFRVLAEEEARLVFNGALDELFEAAHGGALKERVDGLEELLLHYGGSRDDRDLRRIVGELYAYTASLPDGEGWLRSAEAAWRREDGGKAFSAWKAVLLRSALAQIEQAKEGLVEALAICSRGGGPSSFAPSFGAAASGLDDVIRALEAGDWNLSAAALREVPWPRLKSSKDADPLLVQRAKELWDRAKEAVRAWAGGPFCRAEEEWARDVERLQPVVSALIALVLEFGRRYAEAKKRMGAVDFSDLERMALAVLESDGGRAARECREAFDEVMVDEYQDINPVQDRLLTLVSRGEEGRRNRFLVGDVKQSIYRFRLADPTIFQEKHKRFADPGDPGSCRIDLQANFRSHPRIVAFVNYVFRQVMQARCGGIEYGPDAFLHARGRFDAGDDSPRVELHLIERLDPDEAAQPGLPAVEREAAVVGSIIRALTAPGGGGARGGGAPFAYRDIAILMRSPKGRAAAFAGVLEGMGIPVYSRAGSGFFSAVEVDVVINLLKTLDNPRQDIPFAAVLRSPIGGFTSRDLALIRAACREGSFFDAALSAASEDSPLGRRLAAFLARIDGWRTAARRVSLSQLLWQLYHETGYVDFVAALPRGRQREANLWGLYHRAKEFDRFRFQGLGRFLAYVDGLEEAGEEIAPPAALGEGENVVQLISVHQSKGLEFPVVIVADLDRQWNAEETRRAIIFHRDLGIAPAVVDRDAHLRYPSLAHLAVAVQSAQDSLAEEMRLLYVALTRAKERLFLVASARDLERRCALWSESAFRKGWHLSPADVLGARSHLDWIGRAAARHKFGEPIRALGAGDLGADYYAPADPEVRDADVEFAVRIWSGEEAGRVLIAPTSAFRTGGDSGVEALAAGTGPVKPAGEGGVGAKESETVEGAEDGVPEEGAGGGDERDLKTWERLERLFGWSYPAAALTRLPAKLAVTEVARLSARDESEVWDVRKPGMARPAMLDGGRRLSPSERGTAVHVVLSRLAVSDLIDAGRVRRGVAALVDRGILTPEEGEAVDAEKIAAFFQTPLGDRILRAPRLWRELSFTMRVEGGLLAAAFAGDGGGAPSAALTEYRPVVQGAIDCLAVDELGAFVVDFKTDRVRPGEESAAARRYAPQVLLYREFAARWLGGGVPVEPYVVFLETGAAVLADGRDAAGEG